MAFSKRAELEFDDGSSLVALAGNNNARIVKIDADGTETILSNQRSGGSKSQNTKLVLDEFNLIKDAFTAAGKGEELTYDASDINRGGGGFLQPNTPSTLELSGGITIGSKMGNAGTEAANINNYLDAINAVATANKSDDDGDDGTNGDDDDDDDDGDGLKGAEEIVKTDLEEALGGLDLTPGSGPAGEGSGIPGSPAEAGAAANDALAEVGQAGAAALGGGKIGELEQPTSSFTGPSGTGPATELTAEEIAKAAKEAGDGEGATSGTSILTSVPTAVQTASSGTATGGQMEADSAISVGPAEDNAIDMYTKGRRASILTRPGGLLTGSAFDGEGGDPRLRRRRSLLAG